MWAAAVTALGLSILEHMRLKYAPSADWLVRSAAAASRNAWAARLAQRLVLPLKTLPPVGLLAGQVVHMTYTERGDDLHVISLRKATKHEANFYFSQVER